MYLQFYLKQLGYPHLPDFLIKYLKTPSLLRLKNVGYFCGMDYASKDIYQFKEYITRYDHSLSVALITYKLTKNKLATLAGLFHDIATPCFSHVIDYMNHDYENQESTEEYTEQILKNDKYLNNCLQEDNIDIEDIIDFKKYPVVDNQRPKLCADRIDGVILTGIGWTKNITLEDIKRIVKDLRIFKNEFNEEEIGFKSLDTAKRVIEINKSIDILCHSKEDNYMMQLLAKITRLAIEKNYLSYEDLYFYTEKDLFALFKEKNDQELNLFLFEFENIKVSQISAIDLPQVKIRTLNPLVDSKRYLDY